MKNKFKILRALFCKHQLIFGCAFVILSCSSALKAQREVNLDLAIKPTENEPNRHFILGNVIYPKESATSYTVHVTISESPSDVDGITIDLGDGQSHFINVNGVALPSTETLNVSFNDYSNKYVNVTEVLQDNQNPATWSGLLRRFPRRAIEASNYATPDETVPIAGINMHIKYAPNNAQHRLKKPVIFVEGIDFPKEVVYDYTSKPVRVGDFGWDTFITGMVDDPTSSDNETFALLPNFTSQMLNNGYDIVFCDFQDGADYIESNGQSLIEVINEVNRRKKSDLSSKETCYTNSIVGASMGGQVVRWALKTMENQNIDHDCSLYYSLDSPHKGANIPLSLQAFVWFGGNYGPESGAKRKMKGLWDALNRPAAKQLLTLHLENQGENSNYLSMMNQLGYPQNTRNIASCNGSGFGNEQGYANNATMAYAKGTKLGITGFEAKFGASGSDEIMKLFQIFSKSFELPINQPNLSCGFARLVKVNNNTVRREFGVANYSYIPGPNNGVYATALTTSFDKDITQWDNAPGGNRNDMATELMPTIVDGLNSENLTVSSQFPTGRQCFIPAVSALDLATNDLYINVKDFTGNSTSDPVNTPFKSIYYPNTNEPHVFTSPGLLSFALNEIINSTKVSCKPAKTVLTHEVLSENE